jgi:Cu2+-exporting ATPase
MSAAELVIDDPQELGAFTQWHPETEGAAGAESSLQIGGMHCAGCALTVEAALRAIPGVLGASVNASTQTARVHWDTRRTRPSQWLKAVERAGYTAVPDTAAQARGLRERERRLMLWRAFVAVFCSMQVMMMATPSYVSAPGELAPDLKQLLDWGAWLVSLPVLCFSAAPFFRGAWHALRQRRVGMDVPVALGIAVTFIASSGATFDPGGAFGSAVYFDSLTMFVAFLLLGRWFEMQARHRAAVQLESSFNRLPEGVERVLHDGRCETVSARRLNPGDRVRVLRGQGFPADGLILDGETAADEALLTGESRPVPKRPGDAVVAGSMNLESPVEFRVERVGADTRYEAIVALMRQAMSQRPDLGRVADRWAGPFLVAVMVLALGAGLAWHAVAPARALWVAVSVLVVTCPCALSLAVPTALLGATGFLARSGVLVCRLDALETLARVRHVFVDKTGTLTETGLHCSAVRLLARGAHEDPANLQAVAASLGARSTHPLSRALASSCAGPALDWHDLREQPGAGLQGTDGRGRSWRLGSAAWAASSAQQGGEAHASVWLSRDGEALARFDFEEQARGDSITAIRALARQGLKITLLSGDSAPRVQALGAALGLADSRGGLTPEAKLLAVREAQRSGEVVAMIGDGINDAPVMAQADVALAMGDGAGIARSEADMVLLGNSLAGVVTALDRARRTMRIIRQNIAWAALYNAVGVPLALLGLLPPWAAGLGMACSSLFVVLNSLRLAR